MKLLIESCLCLHPTDWSIRLANHTAAEVWRHCGSFV